MNKEILDFMTKEHFVTRLEQNVEAWSTRVMIAALAIPLFAVLALLSDHLRYRTGEVGSVLGLAFAVILLVLTLRGAFSAKTALKQVRYDVGDAAYYAHASLEE